MAKIAIIETGGKQYVVMNDSQLYIEKLPEDHKAGDKITFDKVLLTDDGAKTEVGAPYLAGVKVMAEFLEAGREKKVRVIRYRPKSRSFKKNGHKQPYNLVKITTV